MGLVGADPDELARKREAAARRALGGRGGRRAPGIVEGGDPGQRAQRAAPRPARRGAADGGARRADAAARGRGPRVLRRRRAGGHGRSAPRRTSSGRCSRPASPWSATCSSTASPTSNGPAGSGREAQEAADVDDVPPGLRRLLRAPCSPLRLPPAPSGARSGNRQRDPRLDALIAAGCGDRGAGGRLQVVRGSGLGPLGRRGCSSRTCQGNTVHAWSEAEGLSVFLKPSGYTGSEPYAGPRARLERPDLRRAGPARAVPARRPARRARAKAGRFVTLADRCRRQAPQQPERPGLRQGRRRSTSPIRPTACPRRSTTPAARSASSGVYRAGAGRPGERAGQGPEGAERHRPVARRQDALRGPVRSRQAGYVDGLRRAKPTARWRTGRVFFDATPLKKDGPGLPDGLKVDRDGQPLRHRARAASWS